MSLSLASLPSWILSSAATRSHQILHRHLAGAGINGYQYRCLAVLAEGGQLSQTELGKSAALDPRDITHTVRALEKLGLVVRTGDPKHGRRVLVSLTAAGRNMSVQLGEVMVAVQDEILRDLDTSERATLVELLERVGR
jgi:DNA-binding MarR family transcriptional regulator